MNHRIFGLFYFFIVHEIYFMVYYFIYIPQSDFYISKEGKEYGHPGIEILLRGRVGGEPVKSGAEAPLRPIQSVDQNHAAGTGDRMSSVLSE